nr:hypothetical protein [Tanacetum cinerariifolium]
MMVKAQEDMGEGSANPTDPHYTPTIIPPSTSQPQRLRKTKRKDIELPQTSVPTSIVDEDINEEMNDSLERVSTTATSLDAERDRGNISKTQSKATPNEPGSQRTSADSLKRRVKKLDRRKWSRTHGLKRKYKVGLSARVEFSTDGGLGEEDASKQGRIADIDENEDITLVSTHDEKMCDVDQDLGVDEATLAQALAELKHAKPKAKAKRIVFHEPEESTITTTAAIPKSKSHDNGKAKMI